MRPTLVLLGPLATIDILATRLESRGTYERMDIFDRLTIGECIFRIDASGEVLEDYEESELRKAGFDLEDLGAILVEYQSIVCVRGLLLPVLRGQIGALDTNYGNILSFEGVRNRFSREPDWDWSREA